MTELDRAFSTSTSTFSSGFSSYDVFLNFRGEDTRNNFTGFLNLVMKDKGINVFIDSEKLWIGEAIGPACLQAIKGSKISVPVFSTGYANSKWCLLELVQISQCYESKVQLVFPIFFFVEPSHVRNQTGSFEKAFHEHEKNYEPDTINSWRKALKVIGGLKGEVIDMNKNQAEIVESIVKRVLDILVSNTNLALCKYPIGIDSRVRDFLSLLSSCSSDVQLIGICGPPGIGKTTIAEAVYNCIFSTFSKHSFIPDVSKQAMQGMGLASLQKRLLKDMFNVDFDIGHYRKGKKLIERLLCKEKILLVLDDVDDKDQVDALAGELNWFGPKSRIIITTRSEHILKVAKVEKEKIYWPQELNQEDSLRLFSLHAFSMDKAPDQYHMQLSHEIVHYSGGLPSTLEKLGSSLSDTSCIEEWRSTLRKLKAIDKSKTCIFSLASLRKERSRTCPMKHNPHGWHQQLHGTIGSGNSLGREHKVPGGRMDRNGSTATVRVGSLATTTKNQAVMSEFNGGDHLNPESSTAIDGVGYRSFTIAEVRTATNNFDKSLVIGDGGFGIVYKGALHDGTMAAFKRASLGSKQGRAEFEREIELITKLKHRHVVSIIGFCKEMDEMILVYEYMANGDLSKHLFGHSDLPPLTWKQRLEICIGVARGLLYLHTLGENGIIHRDIKSSNIVLDNDFVAKITDFGISTAGPSFGHTHISVPVLGTIGYADPEYMATKHLTIKSDVYSFGVVMLEVMCGRPASDESSLVNKRIGLMDWALPWLFTRKLEAILDPGLKGKQRNYSRRSLKKFGDIALKCVAQMAMDRPTMSRVLLDLEFCVNVA